MIQILPTFGEKCVEAIRAHLHATGKQWRQLNGKDVSAIIDSVEAAPVAALPAKTPKSRARLMADDEEWLKSLESEPAMRGIDIRKQLGMAQFWAKNNRRECTRKFFENWLLNPRIERAVTADGRGQSSFNRPPEAPGLAEPPLWREWLNANRPESRYATGNDGGNIPWYMLDLTVKRYIQEQISLDQPKPTQP